MKIVLDSSVVLAWCMLDESNSTAEAAMQAAIKHGGVVPIIWWYEIRNALVINERQGRLTAADTHATLIDLAKLDFDIDHDHSDSVILALARRHELTVYDAAYLECALRLNLNLASLDGKLCQAAKAAGIDICSSS